MAVNTTPIFAAKPSLGAIVSPGTADASTTAPTHTNTLDTGAADGTRIEMIRAILNQSTSFVSKCNVFVKAGSTYTLIDQVTIAAATVTTTSVEPVWEKAYESLVLPSGVTLEITSVNTTATASLSVSSFGWDFTP